MPELWKPQAGLFGEVHQGLNYKSQNFFTTNFPRAIFRIVTFVDTAQGFDIIALKHKNVPCTSFFFKFDR